MIFQFRNTRNVLIGNSAPAFKETVLLSPAGETFKNWHQNRKTGALLQIDHWKVSILIVFPIFPAKLPPQEKIVIKVIDLLQ